MNLSNLGAVRRALYASAVLTLFAVPSGAQMVEKERTFADLTASHPCSSGYTGRNAIVTDCDAADDIGDGGGAFRCFAHCDGTAPWEAVSIGGGTGGTAYVLLAGDTDGQTIQGRTGANAARVDIGETFVDEARLIGGGATPGRVYAHSGGVYAESPDGLSLVDVYDTGLDLRTAGDLTVWGATSSIFGIASGPTTIQGAKISFSSQQTAPTNANDTCETGDTIDTASFHYFCYTTNTWVRVAMATW